MKYNIENDLTLKKILRIIINTVSPQKIILFGSRAHGEIVENSDYDILVIKDDIENERTVTKQINYELFKENIDKEVDILATTTKKWNRNINKIGLIYKQIHSEGIVLYG